MYKWIMVGNSQFVFKYKIQYSISIMLALRQLATKFGKVCDLPHKYTKCVKLNIKFWGFGGIIKWDVMLYVVWL